GPPLNPRRDPRRTRLGHRDARSKHVRLPQRAMLRGNAPPARRLLAFSGNEVSDISMGILRGNAPPARRLLAFSGNEVSDISMGILLLRVPRIRVVRG